MIKFFDSVSDPSPTVYADLRTNVHDYWDRGLLGLALDPNFTTNGRLYVLYTYNHILGDPPRPEVGRRERQRHLSEPARLDHRRLRRERPPLAPRDERRAASGTAASTSSSRAGARFTRATRSALSRSAPDGALYAGGGESASFVNTDYGQDFGPGDDTTPDNPCGDPPSPVGTALSPPSAEGGALRSQDMRTSGDPVGLSGTIIRVNSVDRRRRCPTTGSRRSPDLNKRRVVAYGLRNPFRFTFRPGTSELWIGDVGAVELGGVQPGRQPRRAPRELRLAVLRGPEQELSIRLAGPDALRESVRGWHRARARTTPTPAAVVSCPAIRARTGRSRAR